MAHCVPRTGRAVHAPAFREPIARFVVELAMRQRAVQTALLAAVCACSAWHSSALAKPKQKAADPTDGSGCPGFTQKTNNDDKNIEFKLKNKCARPIRCELTWETACGGSDGTRHEESADLEAGATQSFTAQAVCSMEERWRISPATWSCHFRGDESASAKR
jgi:hypothetical protein